MKIVSKMNDHEGMAVLMNIVAELGIGSLAASESVILTNIRNTSRRSDCLSNIENYITESVVSDEPEDEGEQYESSLLNWGHDPEAYIANFKSLITWPLPSSS